MFIRIRLIPITIFFVILMLVFRIGSVWNGIESAQIAQAIPQTPSVLDESTYARTHSAEKSAERKVWNEEPHLAQAELDSLNNFITEVRAQDVDNLPASGNDSGAPIDPEPERIDFADISIRDDPSTQGFTPLTLVDGEVSDDSIIDTNSLSVAEIRLLHTLADRRRQLDSRERGLTERESVLVAAERQLIAQQQELESIRTNIRESLAIYNKVQEEQILQMRAVYSAMKSKNAAQIFNDLELGILINVLRGMTPRKIAPIIASMDVEKARQVTLSLADHKSFVIPE